MRRRSYQNSVLTVIALCLGAMTLERAARWTGGPEAVAQPAISEGTTSGGLVAASDQRKAMIGELRSMSARLERIEAQIARGLTVKVSEMPEIRLPRDRKE